MRYSRSPSEGRALARWVAVPARSVGSARLVRSCGRSRLETPAQSAPTLPTPSNSLASLARDTLVQWHQLLAVGLMPTSAVLSTAPAVNRDANTR